MWFLIRKPLPPVAVAQVLPSSMLFFASSLRIVSVLLLSLLASVCLAQEQKFIAQLHANTPQELAGLLNRAEAWAQGSNTYPAHPIAIILHGPEVRVFIKKNYSKYQSLVDQAAKLDAFKVVDIKICERWMGFNDVSRDQLPPFVDTVPFGPAEEKRLIKTGYQSF